MRELRPDGRIEIKVVQRSDNHTGAIGRLKNKASRRLVTLGAAASRKVSKYMAEAPVANDGLLFPTKSGKPELYANFRRKVWAPIVRAAGYAEQVTVMHSAHGKRHPDGSRVMREVKVWRPCFTPHHGRHFAASALINSGAEPKAVQAFLGHATLAVTMDTYGHLFKPKGHDADMADRIEQALQGASERASE